MLSRSHALTPRRAHTFTRARPCERVLRRAHTSTHQRTRTRTNRGEEKARMRADAPEGRRKRWGGRKWIGEEGVREVERKVQARWKGRKGEIRRASRMREIGVERQRKEDRHSVGVEARK
eukprot:6176311-Pleurochrysis_carterae.AAC.1